MKLLNIILFASVLLTTNAMAADRFYEKGSCYLFTARTNTWNAGEITKITSQELVFKNVHHVFIQEGEDWRQKQDAVIKKYLNGTAKISDTNPIETFNTEAAFSRAAMTAIKLPSCK